MLTGNSTPVKLELLIGYCNRSSFVHFYITYNIFGTLYNEAKSHVSTFAKKNVRIIFKVDRLQIMVEHFRIDLFKYDLLQLVAKAIRKLLNNLVKNVLCLILKNMGRFVQTDNIQMWDQNHNSSPKEIKTSMVPTNNN